MVSGKRRTEIKEIENERSRMVTFSKRCQGLLKKAHQYTAATGSSVTVLVFSVAGKPFFCRYPSFDDVVDSYLNGGQEITWESETRRVGESNVWECFVGLDEKMKTSTSVQELVEVKAILEEVSEVVKKRLEDMADDYMEVRVF